MALWEATAGEDLPFDERIGKAAAQLWCREATWPDQAAIMQSSELSGALIEADLRERVAVAEFGELMSSYRERRHAGACAADALEKAARERVAQLVEVDERLAFLPLLAAIAVRARRDHQAACLRAAACVLTAPRG